MIVGSFCITGFDMPLHIPTESHPVILKIQGLLHKIDRLQLQASSRREVESILVRQVSKEIDRALPWQAGHGRRTATLALMIGQTMGLDSGELHALKLAAFLHDIGLLLLPPPLAARRGFVESESYVAIQNHPRHGATLLEPFSFLREASTIIAHHHERWDGSGYPYGIRGPFIPLGSRILAIADAFDAIRIPGVSNVAARNAIALRIIRVASGTQFDPELVDTLCLFQESIPTMGAEL
jgi:HD-GYP domain-containing protein (c-di-GMP phosphodiesterase class II)